MSLSSFERRGPRSLQLGVSLSPHWSSRLDGVRLADWSRSGISALSLQTVAAGAQGSAVLILLIVHLAHTLVRSRRAVHRRVLRLLRLISGLRVCFWSVRCAWSSIRTHAIREIARWESCGSLRSTVARVGVCGARSGPARPILMRRMGHLR